MTLSAPPLYIRDIPSECTVFSALAARFQLNEAAARFASQRSALQRFELDLDLAALAEACRAAIAEYPLRGFRNTTDDLPAPAYGSLSLTFNPDNPGDPHAGTLGSDHLKQGQYFYGTAETMAQLPQQKGSYYDTYGFRRITPAAQRGALGDLLRGFRLPLVRSRLSVIDANRSETNRHDFGWHRDESIFQNLRINIPVWTAPEYLLEIETQRLEIPAAPSATSETHHLACGQAYSWDTNRPHRVFTRSLTPQSRCHLVIGLAPWFDYDPVTDSWTPNAYFGEVHPHDLVAEGLAHPLIRAGKRRDTA